MIENERNNFNMNGNNNKNFDLKLVVDYFYKLPIDVLFSANAVSLLFGIIYSAIKALFDLEGGGSGFLLLVLPLFAFLYALPSVIGFFLSNINKKKNNYIISIIMFVASLISLMTGISSYRDFNNRGILFVISLISSIALIISLLLRLIYDRKNRSKIMYCKNCQNALKHGDLFCANCGTKVELQTPQTTQQTIYNNQMTNNNVYQSAGQDMNVNQPNTYNPGVIRFRRI